MKKLIFIFPIIFLTLQLFATHNRAGEIVYKHIEDFTYEITVWTFTYTLSMADRDTLDINWGDNTSSRIPRVNETILPGDYRKSEYKMLHTFNGPGIYVLVMEDPNRNEGVLNIPNSVNVMFALTTILQINSLLGHNSTPVLTNDPIDKAALHQKFIHNPGAYDPDGDSLSYKMDTCRYNEGYKIPDFILPAASTEIYVDPISGDLVWDAPMEIGIYNVAMEIEEWRKGIKISSIVRDIQIEVEDTDNEPPVIEEIEDLCVESGTYIHFDVTATDPDLDLITLIAKGAAFEVEDCPATFTDSISLYGKAIGNFKWETCCTSIRKQPYGVVFKATDDHPQVPLSDYQTVNINIVGPATEIVTIEPSNAKILVEWKKNRCENAIGYNLYRSITLDTYSYGECETGLPSDIGYELIAIFDNNEDTTYVDDDNGTGLTQGFYYCYRVVTLFPENNEGYPSQKACAELVKGMPIFTKVSVANTDTEEGKIELEWVTPIDLDTSIVTGPFKYFLYYSRDLYGSFYQGPYTFMGFNSDSYIDTLINTKDNPSIYKLFISNYDPENNTWNTVGTATVAASPFIKIYGANKKLRITIQENVPWENDGYVIYKLNEQTGTFDSLDYTTSNIYTDRNLINGKEYCYKIKSISHYTADSLPDLIINYSQISCSSPIDTIAPCCPTLELRSECEAKRNYLRWSFPADSCRESLASYNIYYTNRLNGDFQLIKSITNLADSFYYHEPELSLAACYYVTAVDSAGNERDCINNQKCIDICSYYELPNIFTPNNDNSNDLYHPFPYLFVEKVDMKIYNRWGNLLFETEDPDINWDGINQLTGQKVPDGVYYYICDVYEHRLTGLEARNLSGFIHLISDEKIIRP